MSVEHIKYKNKKLPVKLGYHALKMMQKEHGVSIEGVQDDISLYEPLLFYSLQQGHKIEKKEFPFDHDKIEEQMSEILEECFFEFVSLIPKFFPELEKTMGVVGKVDQ